MPRNDRTRQDSVQAKETGLAGLPKNWRIAVQLVGTFGLAVFLVLYYVLVMQPRDAKRYEQLRESIASLGQIVASRQSLLTRESASRLEDLFVKAVGYDVANVVTSELRGGATAQAMARKIEDKLILETRSLEGLRREDGGAISEMLTLKIRNTRVSEQIAQRALAQWKDAGSELIAGGCCEALALEIGLVRMAK
jgi:hypothetical protein